MYVHKRSSVLLLEDQVLIAMYVEELLGTAGFADIISCSTCAAAAEWLRVNNPGLAIMETKLGDGACDEIAALLVQRRIPFLIHSVERNGDDKGPDLKKTCRWIEKPSDPDAFLQAIKACVA